MPSTFKHGVHLPFFWDFIHIHFTQEALGPPFMYQLQVILRGHILQTISPNLSNFAEVASSAFLPHPTAVLDENQLGLQRCKSTMHSLASWQVLLSVQVGGDDK